MNAAHLGYQDPADRVENSTRCSAGRSVTYSRWVKRYIWVPDKTDAEESEMNFKC